jgi:hypothetical protein
MDERKSLPKRSPRLEELIRKTFPPEGKAKRIARGLAALNEDLTIHLTPEQWKWIAEDPDLEDQF